MEKDYLLYGRKIFQEALALGLQISEVYFSNDSSRMLIEKDFKIAQFALDVRPKKGIPQEVLHQNHQGIAFRVKHTFYLRNWDVKRDRFPIILLCNHLEDVQNLGALARSAAGFGVSLIVHEERRSVRINSAAVRISAGQAFRMKFLEVANLGSFCRHLRENDYGVVALHHENERTADRQRKVASLFDWAPTFPLALVVGSEGHGLSKSILDQSDVWLRIPMQEKVESLNAAVAGSIALAFAFKAFQKNKA